MRDKKQVSGRFTYKSILTGEYVLPQQWVAEVLVKRKADREQVSLKHRFWLDKESKWTKEYQKQIVQACRLIRKYSEEALLTFIKNNQYKFSLFVKANITEIEKAQKIIDQRPSDKELVLEDATEFVKRKNNKKSLLGKLNGKKKS